jgi:hypothetical protein
MNFSDFIAVWTARKILESAGASVQNFPRNRLWPPRTAGSFHYLLGTHLQDYRDGLYLGPIWL